MTKRRSNDEQAAHDPVGGDPSHAPGKQHLGRPDDESAEGVRPDTESRRAASEGRVGRGRTPRRG